jgi:eukaryotic-like serine/threonine-protein kinase
MSGPMSAEFLALQEVLAGRYSIERELGRGGMGAVLLARDVALDRLVAIKVLPPSMASDATSRDRFLREARTAAGLSHPHIVPIHAVEEHGDLVFFVMGFVDGETLKERVERRGPVTPRYAMKVMQEVAWALAYAHERGVVHRDIKPDNIMIDRATDRAIVTDFGIAQTTGAGSGGPVATGEVIGTARYMSPEQACGDVVDERSDLYSLAATIFFALSGRAPFEGKNLPAILSQQVSQPAPPLKRVRPEAPDRLAKIIDRCLQKDPADRVQTGENLASVLGEVRGRELRAPPLVRSFVRTAEISTMVVLAAAMAGQTRIGGGDWSVSIGGPGLLGTILIIQLIRLARRLLREGYSFNDIRAALLSEAQIQEEEADVVDKARWMRRLDSMWHRLWAGRFGRWFFKVSGTGIHPPAYPVIASADATEMVMGRAAVDLYEALPAPDRTRVGDVPRVVRRLEDRVERMRAEGRTGEEFTNTVAALENIRLALLRLQHGAGSIEDLTTHLERAREIGGEIDRHLQARQEVDELERA